MLSSNDDDGLCPDWIYSESSNVHVAKDKVWFTSYQDFPTKLDSGYGIGDRIPVMGIGTVKLTVKAWPGTFTVYGTSTIELHNVLCIPNYVCNVVGRPLASVYQINLGGSVHEGGPPSRGGLFLHGKEMVRFQAGPLGSFSLAALPPLGMKFGPSPFKVGVACVLSCQWPNEERARWQALQDQAIHQHAPPLLRAPYTIVELDYVNKHWGSEFRFLTEYRLRIHEERDRSEGRRVIRALMRGKDPAEKDGEEVEIDGRLGDCLSPDRGRGAMRVKDFSAPRAHFL